MVRPPEKSFKQAMDNCRFSKLVHCPFRVFITGSGKQDWVPGNESRATQNSSGSDNSLNFCSFFHSFHERGNALGFFMGGPLHSGSCFFHLQTKNYGRITSHYSSAGTDLFYTDYHAHKHTTTTKGRQAIVNDISFYFCKIRGQHKSHEIF